MPTQNPNILWIQCDEIRAHSLSCYDGNPWIRPETPNVARIARTGLVFENAFCPSPVCMPSRGCELTSRHAPALGVYHNVTKRVRDRYDFDTSVPTWPNSLRDAGYRAVNVGKSHMIGYDVWDVDTGCPQFPNQRRLAEVDPPGLDLVLLPGIRLVVGGKYPLKNSDYESFGGRVLTRMALKKIDELEAGDAPWLLRVSYVAPHTPVIAPPPFDSLYSVESFAYDSGRDVTHEGMSEYEESVAQIQRSCLLSPRQVARARASYFGLAAAIDREIGLLSEHVPDDTILLITGDHGAMQGEMGLWQKQIFNRKVHQVPYILSGPGITPGRRSDNVDLLDTGPTLLALCGQSIPDTFNGRDLLSGDLRGKDIFAAFGYGDEGAFMYEALSLGPDCPRRICIRSENYRLDMSVRRGGEPLRQGQQDLFFCNILEDQSESFNAADRPEYRNIVSDLRGRLLDWYSETTPG